MAKKFNMSLGGALLSDVSKELADADYKISYIHIDDIVPNEKNSDFSMEDIEDLKLSIKDIGLEQNLVVMPFEGKYKPCAFISPISKKKTITNF